MIAKETAPSVELKPCPFCGGEAHLACGSDEDAPWWVYCNVGHGTCRRFPCADDAVSGWNRRAERTCRNVDEGREFTCSECGSRYHLLSQGGPEEEWAHVRYPGHCPSCGAEVQL